MGKQKENRMSTLIRIAILSWSAALLTASYAGALSKMDPTFIATVFTASAATFGINTMKKGGDDEDEKKPEVKREEYVVAPPSPEPVWSEPAEQPLVARAQPEETESSLESRVEALESKVDGEDEGFVPPRRGDL
jgi:hypothetical protein